MTTLENKKREQEETEIFGAPMSPAERVKAKADYAEKMRRFTDSPTHTDWKEYEKSLPFWVTDSQRWDLFLMNDNERAEWLKTNEPKDRKEPLDSHNDKPYLKPSTDYVPGRLAGVRF